MLSCFVTVCNIVTRNIASDASDRLDWVDMLSCFVTVCNIVTRNIASDPSDCVRRPVTRPGTTPCNTAWYDALYHDLARLVQMPVASHASDRLDWVDWIMLSCFVIVCTIVTRNIASDAFDRLDWVDMLSCFVTVCNIVTRNIASDPSDCVRRPLTWPGTTPFNTAWYDALQHDFASLVQCKPCIRPIGLGGFDVRSCFL